jgi:tetraacyldisaccharide 4'-kinase
LLAENLRGLAAVVADADRVAAARWALQELGSEVFILDDGFQHLRLARDLNVVTLDATAPWGGGHLLPRGRLREPVGGLARADCVIITRAEHAHDLASLRAQAARLSQGRPVFIARTRTVGFRPLAAAEGEMAAVAAVAPPQPAAAFCAVGNPQAFFAQARNSGCALSHAQQDVDEVVSAAARCGARALVTTAKDAVKLQALRFALPCYVLEIALELEEGERLRGLVRQTITRHQSN